MKINYYSIDWTIGLETLHAYWEKAVCPELSGPCALQLLQAGLVAIAFLVPKSAFVLV
jgi:hypothetical protein